MKAMTNSNIIATKAVVIMKGDEGFDNEGIIRCQDDKFFATIDPEFREDEFEVFPSLTNDGEIFWEEI